MPLTTRFRFGVTSVLKLDLRFWMFLPQKPYAHSYLLAEMSREKLERCGAADRANRH
jgi:hypothetical protein